jgi:hypothetical protein
MHLFNNVHFNEILAAVDSGPFMEAEIVSLTGKGKLRVTCDWLYSALNCDPNDLSNFVWVFYKISDTLIALSPKNNQCISKPVFASVRDDWNWYVQVQAPHSADWIVATARDEYITLKLGDVNVAEFKGFNNNNIAVNDIIDIHDWHSGYRVRSIDPNVEEKSKWFVGVTGTTPKSSRFFTETHEDKELLLRRQLKNCNIKLSDDVFTKVLSQIKTIK